MVRLVCSVLVLAVVTCVTSAAEWALLVAGSNGWYNYRHQSDVCHAYQVLIHNGFPADHIVTMMYDDIAFSHENPVQGELINKPDGPNVYEGCAKDYTGTDVTPDNFLKVLQGHRMTVGSQRVIESTTDDNVFVFFSDHGAPGLIAFPTSELHAADFNDAINAMHQNGQYKKMLLYIEACEGGSMFNNILAENLGVYAVAAADPTHSSYAIYYDTKRATYLGDVFSVNWMADSESHKPASESVGSQFQNVKTTTNTSTVCAYGDSSLTVDFMSAFQGGVSASYSASPEETALPVGDVVDSRDVPVMILKHRIAAASDADVREHLVDQLESEMTRRGTHDLRAARLTEHAATRSRDAPLPPRKQDKGRMQANCNPANHIQSPACLKQMVIAWKAACGPFDDYSLKHVSSLNNLCNQGWGAMDLATAMERICGENPLE